MTTANQRTESVQLPDFHFLFCAHLAEMELYADVLFNASHDLPPDTQQAKVIHALHGAVRDRLAMARAELDDAFAKQRRAA